MSEVSEDPVEADVETIPLIMSSFERNPDRGGTHANERTNRNIDPAIIGSLFPRP